MLPGDLQSLLADCYALNLQAHVDDFVLTDRDATRELIAADAHLPDELLLIRELDESLDLTLFLDPDMLARLADCDPREHLSPANLNDFCRVLEGVSHFVCVIWNAGNARSVTQLGLEVQAEVDKYLGTRLLLESQTGTPPEPGDIPAQLFAGVSYHDELSATQRRRYEQANSLAARYCRQLERRYPDDRLSSSMLHELRRFYRMPQAEKISHINAAQLN